ncbi:major pollen allergen Ole e 10-like isoform X2 [Telopea speciosissima]|uniref:major pollen allergen Ole e 10-like isoform X2 n=1 Tax=Telopea speciosissima TaxID=54955 RepID=UPI001CC597E8|nr:major pollen allergen Ole e 10-like isoform X2 [Telopea speciosissima]
MEIAKAFNQALRFLPMAMAFWLCFAACTESRVVAKEGKQGKEINTWCIVKPSTNEMKLRDNIDYSCKQVGVDCSLIAENGICYNPINLVSHASVAMNLYYKSVGKHHWNCYFNGTALIVTQDPSVGPCMYPV